MEFVKSTEEAQERLLKYYRVYYNVKEQSDAQNPLKAICTFHVHNEKYVLSRKAQLWTTNCNEYVYLFMMPHLTTALFEECKIEAYEQGMKQIKPDQEHMYSYITAIFLCETCEKDAEKALRKCRLYKSFRLGFHGWMNYRTAVYQTADEKIACNHIGRDVGKILKNVLEVKN